MPFFILFPPKQSCLLNCYTAQSWIGHPGSPFTGLWHSRLVAGLALTRCVLCPSCLMYIMHTFLPRNIAVFDARALPRPQDLLVIARNIQNRGCVNFFLIFEEKKKISFQNTSAPRNYQLVFRRYRRPLTLSAQTQVNASQTDKSAT